MRCRRPSPNWRDERGASLHYGQAVQRILVRDGRACGVRLADGRELQADSVVFNGDANALAQGLLGGEPVRGRRPRRAPRRSLSALTWAVHARSSGFALERHNVFFCDDYQREFDDMLRRRQLPQQGTVYVCAQDRGDAAVDADGARAPAVPGQRAGRRRQPTL